MPTKNMEFSKVYPKNPDGSERIRGWFIFYEDTEHPPAFFTDEIQARKAYAHELQNWHCHLLEQVADPLYDFKADKVLNSYEDHKDKKGVLIEVLVINVLNGLDGRGGFRQILESLSFEDYEELKKELIEEAIKTL